MDTEQFDDPSEDEFDDSLEGLTETSQILEASTTRPKTLSLQPMFQTLFMQSIDNGDPVLADFGQYVVGPLSDKFGMAAAKGGAFFQMKAAQGAPNTERYSRDQTLRAHLINGMLPARHIARLLYQWGAESLRHWDEMTERLYIAGYMLHDFTKIEDAKKQLKDAGFKEMEAPSENLLPLLDTIFLDWGQRLGLDNFLEPVGGLQFLLRDIIHVAVNTQRYSGTAHAPFLLPGKAAKSDQYMLATSISTLADLMAYVARTPRELVAHPSINAALSRLAFNTRPMPGAVAHLTYHHIAENRGLLLNFIHDTTLRVLENEARVPLLYAPSGVVYLERYNAPPMPAPEDLVQQVVSDVRIKVAHGLVTKKKAVKLGKDGLRTDDIYQDVFNLRELVTVSTALAEMVRSNAPQYLEKLVTLGYPGGHDLPHYATDPKDVRLRQMAEWASLLEIQYETRAPELLQAFHEHVLANWEIADLAEQFEVNRTYKPSQSAGTGIRYHWYWAAAHTLSRKPGIDPTSVVEWLEYISNQLALALPQDLPESALPNEQIWNDLVDYVSRVLTLGDAKSQISPANELSRYARAKAGRGGSVCAICGSTYPTRKAAETAVAFQPGVYTARIKISGSDNKRNLCSICALEQLLRQLFVENLDSGGSAEGQRIRYLAFYPSYFFTPETLRFIRRAYMLIKDIHLSDKDLRRSLNNKPDLTDTAFWQRLDAFLLRALDADPSKRVVRYGEEAQSTFLMVGFRGFGDPTDTESWIIPAFLALVLPICLDVKVVASESSAPLILESDEMPKTVWFDGAHSAIRALVVNPTLKEASTQINVDEIMSSLARLTAAYMIHLDTEYQPPKDNWQRFAPIAHSLMESPLYVFHYLKKQERDDRPVGIGQVRRYIAYAEKIFTNTKEGDQQMTLAKTLVEQYRGFYRAKTPLNGNRIRRPLDVVAETLLKADQRLFPDADAMYEVAYGELSRFMDRVGKGLADGRFPKGVSAADREAAMRTFCKTFVNDLFIGIFNRDVAALRGKQLNLFSSACEALYRDMQYAEWQARGRDEDEPDESESPEA